MKKIKIIIFSALFCALTNIACIKDLSSEDYLFWQETVRKTIEGAKKRYMCETCQKRHLSNADAFDIISMDLCDKTNDLTSKFIYLYKAKSKQSKELKDEDIQKELHEIFEYFYLLARSNSYNRRHWIVQGTPNPSVMAQLDPLIKALKK
jgi:hypothetical protein